ncbi:hypothetical protein Tco_1561638 [Tanacetum coccineum]
MLLSCFPCNSHWLKAWLLRYHFPDSCSSLGAVVLKWLWKHALKARWYWICPWGSRVVVVMVVVVLLLAVVVVIVSAVVVVSVAAGSYSPWPGGKLLYQSVILLSLIQSPSQFLLHGLCFDATTLEKSGQVSPTTYLSILSVSFRDILSLSNAQFLENVVVGLPHQCLALVTEVVVVGSVTGGGVAVTGGGVAVTGLDLVVLVGLPLGAIFLNHKKT